MKDTEYRITGLRILETGYLQKHETVKSTISEDPGKGTMSF